MENVGCVIYRDEYIEREEIFSENRKHAILVVFLHEISHMWFGNLVTMKWWDDLWLNESFATYMSFLAMANIPELKFYDTVWATFLRYKFWGISTD